MDSLTIVRVVAVVGTGLLAGIYLGYRIGTYYALQKFTASSFVQFQQVLHTHFVKFLPPILLGAVAATIGWLFMVRSQRGTEFWLIASSACGLLLTGAITRAVNVPLNNRLMTWNTADPPTNLREIWAPWDRVNTIRTIVSVGVLVLEASALSVRASASPL